MRMFENETQLIAQKILDYENKKTVGRKKAPDNTVLQRCQVCGRKRWVHKVFRKYMGSTYVCNKCKKDMYARIVA